jgi:hypothetical protein
MSSAAVDRTLFEQGMQHLRDLLGEAWNLAAVPGPGATANQVVQINLAAGGATGKILVEATREPSPLLIRQSVAPRLSLMRELVGEASALVVAPWLSPRTRNVLDDLGYSYLDLTGNVQVRLPRLGIVLRTTGAARDPEPGSVSSQQQLRGDRAGRLVRALVDVVPPYRGGPLAEATGLSPSYVSRLLRALTDQGLIQGRGREVVQVEWPDLLREKSSSYILLKASPAVHMVAPKGTDDVLERLKSGPGYPAGSLGRLAVTGPVAASAVAPLTVGGQLMIHVEDDTPAGLSRAAAALGLLPARAGGDVLLLRSAGSTAFLGLRDVRGVRQVAPSQLVLDSLGGTGRMPAEGEAVIKHMLADESRWRLPDLQTWADDRRHTTPLRPAAE